MSSTDNTKQSSQRTDKPAVKTGHKKIEQKGQEKDTEYKSAAFKKSLFDRDKSIGAINDRQKDEVK